MLEEASLTHLVSVFPFYLTRNFAGFLLSCLHCSWFPTGSFPFPGILTSIHSQFIKLASLIPLFLSLRPLFLQFSLLGKTIPLPTEDSLSLLLYFFFQFVLILLSAFFWYLYHKPPFSSYDFLNYFIFLENYHCWNHIYHHGCFLSLALCWNMRSVREGPCLFCTGILSSTYPAYKCHSGMNWCIARKPKSDSQLHQSVGSWPSIHYIITVNLFLHLPK